MVFDRAGQDMGNVLGAVLYYTVAKVGLQSLFRPYRQS